MGEPFLGFDAGCVSRKFTTFFLSPPIRKKSADAVYLINRFVLNNVVTVCQIANDWVLNMF